MPNNSLEHEIKKNSDSVFISKDLKDLIEYDNNGMNRIIRKSTKLEINDLQLINIKVHVLILLKDIGRLVEHVVEEFGENQCRPLVLILRVIQLALEFYVLVLEGFVVYLTLMQFLFNIIQFMLQEIDQIFISLVLEWLLQGVG